MRLHLDTEFTSFDCKVADLISIAIVTDNDQMFYGEFTDVNWEHASDFVLRNVKPLLGKPSLPDHVKLDYKSGSQDQLRWELCRWMKQQLDNSKLKKGEKISLDFWMESGDFDWVYFASWLAADYAGNLTDFSQAIGIPFPYFHKDLIQYCSPDDSDKRFEETASSDTLNELKASIGNGNKHAAWADALKLRAMVSHFEKL